MKKYEDKLFDLRLKLTKFLKGEEWSMSKLERVLKTLKNNKAKDSHGHICELLRNGGRSLKVSILKMFNKIKKDA